MPAATSVFLMVQPRSRRLSLPKPVLVWSGCSLGMRKTGEQFGGFSMPPLGTMVSPWHLRTRSSEWTQSLSSLFSRRGILTWNLVSMFKCNSWLLLGSWTVRGNDPPEGNPHSPPERDLASGPTRMHVFPSGYGLMLAVTWLWGQNCTSWSSGSTADTRQSCLLDVSWVRKGSWRAPLFQALLLLASLLYYPPLTRLTK